MRTRRRSARRGSAAFGSAAGSARRTSRSGSRVGCAAASAARARRRRLAASASSRPCGGRLAAAAPSARASSSSNSACSSARHARRARRAPIAAGQLAARLQLREHLLGLRGVGGHLLGVGELGALALLHQLEVVQVRADDVDLLVEHAEQLLAALEVLAELQELAGDAALGDRRRSRP